MNLGIKNKCPLSYFRENFGLLGFKVAGKYYFVNTIYTIYYGQ